MPSAPAEGGSSTRPPLRSSAPGGRRRRAVAIAVRGITHAVMLCALTALVLIVVRSQVRRFPSARPVEGGFSMALAVLCEHAGVPARDWRHIVIHHSATTGGGAKAFERYHVRVRRWDSLGYHFVIGNGTQTADGEIEVGRRWTMQQVGSHARVREYNERGIGICLVGDFTFQHPTEMQMRGLENLVRHLMGCYHIPPENVLGHRECPGAATECPGSNFPIEELRRSLSREAPQEASFAPSAGVAVE